MASFMLACIVLVLLVSAAAAQTAGNASAPICPINDYSKVDWTTAKAACGDISNPSFCNSCICSVGLALVVGLEAAGAQVNGQSLTALAASDPNAVNGILGQCQTTLGLQLLQSGAITADAVAKLAQCNIEAAGDACLQQVSGGAVPVASANGPVPVGPSTNSPAAAAQVAALKAARSSAHTAVRALWVLVAAFGATVMLA